MRAGVEPVFLSVEEVLDIQTMMLDLHGGQPGIRDRSALESAVGMPLQTFGGQFVHANVFEMAAAYAFHIAQNQAFVDGNERTALAAALTFLRINGVSIVDPSGRLYTAVIAFATNELDKPGLAKLLGELVSED
jgi:death on curing protein